MHRTILREHTRSSTQGTNSGGIIRKHTQSLQIKDTISPEGAGGAAFKTQSGAPSPLFNSQYIDRETIHSLTHSLGNKARKQSGTKKGIKNVERPINTKKVMAAHPNHTEQSARGHFISFHLQNTAHFDRTGSGPDTEHRLRPSTSIATD